jgi:hypothetical protein
MRWFRPPKGMRLWVPASLARRRHTADVGRRARQRMSLTKPAHDVSDRNSDQRVEVSSAASDQEAVIANLFELYAYDLSQTFDLHTGPDGRYGY